MIKKFLSVNIPDDLWHLFFLKMILFSPKKQSAGARIQMFWWLMLSQIWMHKFKIATSDNQLIFDIYDLNDDIAHQTGKFSEIQVMMMMMMILNIRPWPDETHRAAAPNVWQLFLGF